MTIDERMPLCSPGKHPAPQMADWPSASCFQRPLKTLNQHGAAATHRAIHHYRTALQNAQLCPQGFGGDVGRHALRAWQVADLEFFWRTCVQQQGWLGLTQFFGQRLG